MIRIQPLPFRGDGRGAKNPSINTKTSKGERKGRQNPAIPLEPVWLICRWRKRGRNFPFALLMRLKKMFYIPNPEYVYRNSM